MAGRKILIIVAFFFINCRIGAQRFSVERPPIEDSSSLFIIKDADNTIQSKMQDSLNRFGKVEHFYHFFFYALYRQTILLNCDLNSGISNLIAFDSQSPFKLNSCSSFDKLQFIRFVQSGKKSDIFKLVYKSSNLTCLDITIRNFNWKYLKNKDKLERLNIKAKYITIGDDTNKLNKNLRMFSIRTSTFFWKLIGQAPQLRFLEIKTPKDPFKNVEIESFDSVKVLCITTLSEKDHAVIIQEKFKGLEELYLEKFELNDKTIEYLKYLDFIPFILVDKISLVKQENIDYLDKYKGRIYCNEVSFMMKIERRDWYIKNLLKIYNTTLQQKDKQGGNYKRFYFK
jgi:hypothetical protein